jgi:alpha-D-ribose 1-methylphosphonate 5-triphosphate synthase subunit PhnL
VEKKLSLHWLFYLPFTGIALAFFPIVDIDRILLCSYRPAPFFVLDEVDAALDNTNVAKIAQYIRDHASQSFQFVVISLKNSLYERGESLVGIYRDQDVNSSRTLTLDVRYFIIYHIIRSELMYFFSLDQLTQYDE